MHMGVDEAGADGQAGGIEHLGAVCCEVFADRGDHAVVIDQNVAQRVGIGIGIEQSSVLDQQHNNSPYFVVTKETAQKSALFT